MENQNSDLCNTIYTGKLVNLIDKSMLAHTVFDGTVNHMCLFTSRPTRFLLVPGTLEHAYYAILYYMVDYCEKYNKMVLQIGNDFNTCTMEFKCDFTTDNGNTYRTVMNHSKIYKSLLTFAQDRVGSLQVILVGYNI